MELQVFQVGAGDCMLLSSGGALPRHILIDGGYIGDFKDNVRQSVYNLPHLDVVCLSHIDNDHIGGILQLFRDKAACAEAVKLGKSKPKHCPPQVQELWINDLRGRQEQPTTDLEVQLEMLRDAAGEYFATMPPPIAQEPEIIPRLVTIFGYTFADELLAKATSEQHARINTSFGGGLIFLEKDPVDPVHLGPLKVHLLGPFREDLRKHKENDWPEKPASSKQDAMDLVQGWGLNVNQAIGEVKRALDANCEGIELGKDHVTDANYASIMFLVEENNKTILFSGDGHAKHLLKGLEIQGLLHDDRLHVNVLKIPHHGAAGNMSEDFMKRITADQYIFCANGEDDNPEICIVLKLIEHRVKYSESRPSKYKFKLWFNTAPQPDKNTDGNRHLTKLEKEITGYIERNGLKGQVEYCFNNKSSFNIPI